MRGPIANARFHCLFLLIRTTAFHREEGEVVMVLGVGWGAEEKNGHPSCSVLKDR